MAVPSFWPLVNRGFHIIGTVCVKVGKLAPWVMVIMKTIFTTVLAKTAASLGKLPVAPITLTLTHAYLPYLFYDYTSKEKGPSPMDDPFFNINLRQGVGPPWLLERRIAGAGFVVIITGFRSVYAFKRSSFCHPDPASFCRKGNHEDGEGEKR